MQLTDDYRVRVWPRRNLIGRQGWAVQNDSVGRWESTGDQPLTYTKWFRTRDAAEEWGVAEARSYHRQEGHSFVAARIHIGPSVVEVPALAKLEG